MEADLLEAWEDARHLPPQIGALKWLAFAAPELDDDARAMLSIGRRDQFLRNLRARLFGNRVELLAGCPACGERAEVELDLASLPTDLGDSSSELTVTVSGNTAQVRVPTAADLAALGGADPVSQLLARCLVHATDAGGAPLAATGLPAELRAAIDAALETADPMALLALELSCPACETHWVADFDIAHCLARELNAWAVRTLAEIHELASAYGWREPDILALSPCRRQAYLELVRA
jgi:hypothetical protein